MPKAYTALLLVLIGAISTATAGQFSNQYSSPTVKMLLHFNNNDTTKVVNEVNGSTVGFFGAASMTTGKYGNAYAGVRAGSNYILVTKSSDCYITKVTDDWIISFWVTIGTIPSAAGWQSWIVAFSCETGGIVGIGQGTGTAADNDNLQYYQDTAAGGNDQQTGTINLSSNTWYYVSWYINRSTGKMRSFINGVAEAAEFALLSTVETRVPKDARIGMYVADNCHQGLIDEFLIMKRTSQPWTAAEVLELYNKAKGRRAIR